MKTLNIKYIILALVLTLGVGITSAQTTSSWTNAPANPPSNNVAPPINNGVKGDGTVDVESFQTKFNGLLVGGVLSTVNFNATNLFKYNPTVDANGAPATNRAGKVLTALDNEGRVGWVSPAGVNAVTKIIEGNNITIESTNEGGRGDVTIHATGSTNPQETGKINAGSSKTFLNGQWKSIHFSGQQNSASEGDAAGAGAYIIKMPNRNVAFSAFVGQGAMRTEISNVLSSFSYGVGVAPSNINISYNADNGNVTVGTGTNVQLIYVVYY